MIHVPSLRNTFFSFATERGSDKEVASDKHISLPCVEVKPGSKCHESHVLKYTWREYKIKSSELNQDALVSRNHTVRIVCSSRKQLRKTR